MPLRRCPEPGCGKDVQNLYKHTYRVHRNDGAFTCQHCGHRSNRLDNYKRHINTCPARQAAERQQQQQQQQQAVAAPALQPNVPVAPIAPIPQLPVVQQANNPVPDGAAVNG
jgi:hypothetical protein